MCDTVTDAAVARLTAARRDLAEPVAGLTGDPEARGRRPAEPARTTRSGVPGRGESCNLDVLRFVGPADPAGAPARPEGTA